MSLRPDQLAPLVGAPVLAVGARSADVLFGCGGVLIHHAAAGDPLRLLLLETGDEGARALAELTGVEPERWDGGEVSLAAALAGIARGRLYAPSPFEREAGRLVCWRAVDRALAAAPAADRPELLGYEVAERLRPTDRRDVAATLPAKLAALRRCPPPPGLTDPAAAAEALAGLRAADQPPQVSALEAFLRLAPEEAGAGYEALARYQAAAPELAELAGERVSIIIRSRDRPARLREALASLAMQRYRPLQAVLVDTGARASELAPPPGLELVCVRAAGASRGAALNAGLAAADGRWIGYLDDDDALLPEHVARLAAALARGPQRLAYSDGYTVTEPEGGGRRPRKLAYDIEATRALLLSENVIPICAVLHDRSLIDAVGGFDEDLPGYEDWEMWLRMAAETDFRHVPVASYEYRISSGAGGRQRSLPSEAERRALAALQTRHADDRAATRDQAIAELRALADRRAEALEPLRSEVEQLRAEVNGLRQERRRRDA